MTTHDLLLEKVVVTNTWNTYSSYLQWVEEYVPIEWQYSWARGRGIDDCSSTYTVLICEPHLRLNDVILAYIQNDTNGDCFVIGLDGIEFCNPNISRDDLVELVKQNIEDNIYDNDNIEVGELSVLF